MTAMVEWCVLLSNLIEITLKYFYISSIRSEVTRMILLIFIYFILHFLIYSLLKLIFNLFSSKRQKSYKWMSFFSIIFGVVKGIVVILIMFIAVIIFNSTVGRNIAVNIFEEFSSYFSFIKINALIFYTFIVKIK